jgi:hypothetical protein
LLHWKLPFMVDHDGLVHNLANHFRLSIFTSVRRIALRRLEASLKATHLINSSSLFHGRELEDGNTLNDYGVGPIDTIYLILRSSSVSRVPAIPRSYRFFRETHGSFEIRVRSFHGMDSLHVRLTDRIGSIKLAAGCQSLLHTRLLSGEQELDDTRTFGDYGIPQAATIDLVLHEPPDFPGGGLDLRISVAWRGSYIGFDMTSRHPIKAIQYSIQDNLGIPPHLQWLLFAGRWLEDGNTLGDYGIMNEAAVHLVLRVLG